MSRILLAGATGVIGRRLLPELVAAGHEVVGTTRSAERIPAIEATGAAGAVLDVFDPAATAAVVAAATPDLILHELTDLGAGDRATNARLRREGTANLVAAARAAGVGRMIVQSIAWSVEPGSAVDEMERRARDLLHATILRYGLLYGPATWYPDRAAASSAAVAELVHVDDVATATVRSLSWPDGTYTIADDRPAMDWTPAHPAPGGRMGG